MRRRKRRNSSLVPHTIVLLFLLAIVMFLYSRRHRVLDRFTYHAGWVGYGTVSNTYDICIDSRDPHRIWFATAEGLRSLDKRTNTWTYLGQHNGLAGEEVTSVEDGGDTLWISTWRGVNYLVKKTGRIGTLPLPATLLKKRIFRIKPDGDRIWIGTDGRGVYCYTRSDRSTERFTERTGLPDNSVYDFYCGDTAVWCAGAANSLSRYSRATGAWSPVETPGGNPQTQIWTIRSQYDSLLWMATSNAGVWQYDLKHGGWKTYGTENGFLDNATYTLTVSGDEVWVGTKYCVMRYINQADAWLNIIKPGERKQFRVAALASAGNEIWYGTLGKGVGTIYKDNLQWLTYRVGLSGANVHTLASDGDDLWVGFGYQAGGVDRLGARSLEWVRNYNRYDGLRSPQINRVISSGRKTYAASWNGLYELDWTGDSWRRYGTEDGLPGRDVTALAVSGRTLWAGTSRGLCRKEDKAASFTLVLPDRELRLTALLADGERGVWAGTYGGQVWYFGVDKKSKGPYLEDNTLVITSLAFFEHLLWIGTRENGLLVLDPEKGTDRRVRKKARVLNALSPGLICDRIAALAVMDGNLWIGTDDGISVRDSAGNWRDVRYADGLLNDYVTSFTEDENYLWIGHAGGITRVDKKGAGPPAVTDKGVRK